MQLQGMYILRSIIAGSYSECISLLDNVIVFFQSESCASLHSQQPCKSFDGLHDWLIDWLRVNTQCCISVRYKTMWLDKPIGYSLVMEQSYCSKITSYPCYCHLTLTNLIGQCSLNLYVLENNEIKHGFLCFLVIHVSTSVTFQALCPFSVGFFDLLSLIWTSGFFFLHIFWTQIISQ